MDEPAAEARGSFTEPAIVIVGAWRCPDELTVHSRAERSWAGKKTDPVSLVLPIPHRLLTPIQRTTA